MATGFNPMSMSYAMMVRDGILDRIKVMPFFTNPAIVPPFTYTKNRAMQIQPQSLPLCGVYFLQESGTPEGDANAGEVRFSTSVRLGFTVIIVNNDMEAAEYTLDLAFEAIRTGLFTDPTFYNNDDFQIEGFTFGIRKHNFGSQLENETPLAELQWELVCDLGVLDYPPVVLDDFDILHIKTAFPLGGTQAEQDAVQQVVNEYDLPQN
jgi:hypothetical protein